MNLVGDLPSQTVGLIRCLTRPGFLDDWSRGQCSCRHWLRSARGRDSAASGNQEPGRRCLVKGGLVAGCLAVGGAAASADTAVWYITTRSWSGRSGRKGQRSTLDMVGHSSQELGTGCLGTGDLVAECLVLGGTAAYAETVVWYITTWPRFASTGWEVLRSTW